MPHEADQKRVVSTRVDDVIRAIVELGGTYPDVVQALQEAKAAGCLEGRFEIDALPEAGRTYEATVDGRRKGGRRKAGIDEIRCEFKPQDSKVRNMSHGLNTDETRKRIRVLRESVARVSLDLISDLGFRLILGLSLVQ